MPPSAVARLCRPVVVLVLAAAAAFAASAADPAPDSGRNDATKQDQQAVQPKLSLHDEKPRPDGELVAVTIDVENPGPAPVSYVGYTADSFDPPIPKGRAEPLYRVELKDKGGEWRAHQMGWCGTGRGPVAFQPGERVSFTAHLPAGEWAAARVGVTCNLGTEQEPRWVPIWSPEVQR